MRIAHVTYGLGMGGIETMLVNITREQAGEGHDVHLIILNDIVDPSLKAGIAPRVRLHLLERPRGSRNPLHVMRLNTVLRTIAPDVIHLHYSSLARYILLPGLKKKLCVTVHAMCTPANIEAIHKAGPVFAISDMVRDDLLKKTGIEAVTVHNGILSEEIVRRQPSLRPSSPFRIVQVGRLSHKVKGQDILIEAVARLIKKGCDLHLTLIGEGESRQELMQLVEKLGITANVEFLGNKAQSFVFSNMAGYDLLVLPSRIEGFGLAVAEAMAAGVPVLTSNHDGPMEIIDHGRFGFHFKSDDATDCARMIAQIIANYPDARFLDAAANRAVTDFNVRTTARRYLSLYSEVIPHP